MTAFGRGSPVPSARMPLTGSLRYGDDRPTHVHAGVDLVAPAGTAVQAPEGGIVVDVAPTARPPWRGYAPCVFMVGDSGRFHLLAHLSGAPIPVHVGDRVELGQQLGTIGPAERHTHWEVRTLERRRTGEPAIEHSLSPAAWLEGQDVPFSRAGSFPRPRCPQRRSLVRRRMFRRELQAMAPAASC